MHLVAVTYLFGLYHQGRAPRLFSVEEAISCGEVGEPAYANSGQTSCSKRSHCAA